MRSGCSRELARPEIGTPAQSAAQLLHAHALGRQLDRRREPFDRPEQRRMIDRFGLDPDPGLERRPLRVGLAREHVGQRAQPRQRLSARREPAPLGVAGEEVRDAVEREVEHRQRIAFEQRARALHLEMISRPGQVPRELVQAIAVADAQPGAGHVRLEREALRELALTSGQEVLPARDRGGSVDLEMRDASGFDALERLRRLLAPQLGQPGEQLPQLVHVEVAQGQRQPGRRGGPERPRDATRELEPEPTVLEAQLAQLQVIGRDIQEAGQVDPPDRDRPRLARVEARDHAAQAGDHEIHLERGLAGPGDWLPR